MNQEQTTPPRPTTGPTDRIIITMEEELKIRFTYHPPSPEQTERYQKLRDAAYAFALLIYRNTPQCREQSTALTKLEEAVFSANAAIARRELPHTP